VHALVDDVLLHLISQPILEYDNRPGAGSNHAWWKGNTGECGWYIWAYESLWLPESLLDSRSQQRLADALFAASRHSGLELHFNKGLGGAPPEAIAAARDTATNPAVLSAFALAIAADGQGPAYPGLPGHEPSVDEGRRAAERIDRCVNELRAVSAETGAYVSESNYFERGWQQSYWGSNYPRLAEIKRKYDPDGLFIVHNGVGSEHWSRDGFTRL
jgi:FAD/FMN-containing dehydrogenase